VRRIASAVFRNEHSVLTVSTLLKREYGLDGVCLSIPCVVGTQGIERIVTMPLAGEEEKALQASARVIQSTIQQLQI